MARYSYGGADPWDRARREPREAARSGMPTTDADALRIRHAAWNKCQPPPFEEPLTEMNVRNREALEKWRADWYGHRRAPDVGGPLQRLVRWVVRL